MGRPKISAGTPAQQAIRRGERILDRMECDGADFVRMDDTHAYLWYDEQLVNLYNHQHVLDFLARHGFLKPRTENKMIIAAWVIFAGIQRCA